MGLEVHVAWCPLDSPALQSRYLKRVHRIPPYRKESDDWIESFQLLLRDQQFDLVLPTTDYTILPFQLHRAAFEGLARICLLPDDVYRTCSDKKETYQLALQEGVPVPRQRVIRNVEEAIECARDFGYPLVLKPKRSAVDYEPDVRQAVRKAYDDCELSVFVKEMTAGQEILAQDNFIGNGVGVEVLCKDGEVLTALQHERVHEPLAGGGSSYRKSVALHDGMFSAACRMMKALRYTGVAMVEYKQNHASGEWVLMEINPRLWGSLPLTIAAGLDFPRYLYEMLVEGRAEFPRAYRVGVFSRHWTNDVQWLIANIRADRSDSTLLSRPLMSVALEIRNILSFRERSDTLVFDDPSPAWTDLIQFSGEKVFSLQKRFQSLRRRERGRLLRLYRSANNVLVLCYGNICRSPFAEHLLSRAAKGKTITSAGTYLRAGRASPSAAVEAAAAFGVDLGSHRSKVATPEELKSAGLIIVFDRRNWLAVRSMCPEALSRVAYLGAADPGRPLEVQDPFGHESSDFRECYSHIRELIQRLAV
jgi:protein-tyrosine-phosphatase/predicted ATP-grasp superfamily ATP-dependent carboligase